jgi:uncharacterized RDD family membrane protein YckC
MKHVFEELQPPRPSVGIRIASMAIDHFIVGTICGFLSIPFLIGLINSEGETFIESPGFWYVLLGSNLLYFLKDSFGGRSIAKRILRLQVVNAETGRPASVLRCFIRNLPIIIWPLEVLVTLSNPERRLGDRMAGTRVAYYPKPARSQSVLPHRKGDLLP